MLTHASTQLGCSFLGCRHSKPGPAAGIWAEQLLNRRGKLLPLKKGAEGAEPGQKQQLSFLLPLPARGRESGASAASGKGDLQPQLLAPHLHPLSWLSDAGSASLPVLSPLEIFCLALALSLCCLPGTSCWSYRCVLEEDVPKRQRGQGRRGVPLQCGWAGKISFSVQSRWKGNSQDRK